MDEAAARRLWEIAEKLTKVKYFAEISPA